MASTVYFVRGIELKSIIEDIALAISLPDSHDMMKTFMLPEK